ncbi:DUF3109 family protein [Odoribacter sp. OttesenSCG-928-L07]|nr:DUF3109 family protein [Odoribacter sp. OttesenSCG-928-L07]MDL2238600.1 DUF3109 family protein [Bacteroidales bacterium OttesenSCG-928-L14]MDL2240914.1 DUF3109 family protein [Bacteroidales bacterium OttesenSCG-928-K22]
MFAIKDCLISDDIKTVKFCCDLSKCRGECCIAGDCGAPLEEEEISLIEDYLDKITPYMTKEGIDTVKSQGVFDYGLEGEYVTTLIDEGACAFVYSDNGVIKCSIEKAFKKGEIPFNKPISCHLYPIRLKIYNKTTAVNYDQWDICKDAVSCGKSKDIKLYEFLKEPLIRRFGEEWYEDLCEETCEE